MGCGGFIVQWIAVGYDALDRGLSRMVGCVAAKCLDLRWKWAAIWWVAAVNLDREHPKRPMNYR